MSSARPGVPTRVCARGVGLCPASLDALLHNRGIVPAAVPRLLLAYHFFHPDDVIGARLFTDLAVEQQRRGWDVTVLTSNRMWRDARARLPLRETWEGIEIHRTFRPPWSQNRPLQRLGNSAWMVTAWLAQALPLGEFDAAVIGSDPAFAALVALGLRPLRPRAAIAHWCFDLYPEAIAAEGTSPAATSLTPTARRMMALAYRRYDALIDLGPVMGERIATYGAGVYQETIAPWALAEAERPVAVDGATRRALFPRAKLALLYSGTMGRAHDFDLFLRLARRCRARSGDAITLCFVARGNRADALAAALGPDDTNVVLAPFADEGELAPRLAAADVHLVSLRADWAGVVVPSKFFASLAIGRPILYAGPAESEIARWIAQHDLGLHLTEVSVDAVADRLHDLIDDPAALPRWRENALAVYRRNWSKQVANDRWNGLLRELLETRARAA
jgi:colanic acid biosynthesis glycosyl transferase WcaI